jgi:hypothetical protein
LHPPASGSGPEIALGAVPVQDEVGRHDPGARTALSAHFFLRLKLAASAVHTSVLDAAFLPMKRI